MAKNLEKELLSQAEAISNFGIWELDIKSNDFYWSDGVFIICGYEPQEFEVTFEKNLSVIHPDDREFTIAQIQNTIATGKEFDVRKRFITKSGNIKYINSKGKLIKDAQGNAIKLRGVFQDITHTIELENTLKNSVNELKARNEFIETILQNLPIGIAVNKIDTGEATLVNDQFAASYGWNNSDLADVTSFFEKVYPEETYRNEMVGKIVSDIQSGNPDRMNWTGIKVTTSTGTQKIIDAKNIPLFEQNLMISTVVDVTEKVLLNDQKNAQEADLKALIENTPDIIYSVDMDFKLLTYNSVFYNFMLKLGRGKVSKGINVFDLYSPQKQKQYKAIFDKVHQGNRHVFEDIISFEGVDLYFEVAVNPILNDSGEQIGVSIFSKDITDKKQNEKEIDRIKKNHEAIINSTDDLIWSIDSEMHLITSNKAFNKAILDITGREIKYGDHILMAEYDEETNKKWSAFYKRGLSGETFNENYKDNSFKEPVYMLLSFSPMYDDEKKIWGLACNAKNNTDETISFLNLQKKDAELEKIINSSLDVICTFNKNNEFVKVNAASERVWGYKPEELVGRNYDFLVHPDDINLTDTTTEEIQGGVNVLNFENRNIKKDGTIIPMLWSANHDEKEEITYCVAKDVSANKKTEEKLRLSEQYFKNLIQNGGDLVGILNLEGDYLYVSPSSHSILGIPAEELIGKNCFSFMHLDDKDNIEQDFIKLATSQRVQFEPFRFKHNNGSWLWIEAVGTNLFDDEAINGLVINARNITDKVKKDNALENANKILKNAQKITKMGNWEYNLATDELFWSDELYQIFEIDKDDSKILNFNDFGQFIHPDDIIKVIEAKNTTVSTGKLLSIQHRIITKNKREKIVRELAEKVFNKETNSFWLYGTIRDSTEAVLNQKRIELSEKKYKYLFDNNPSAMFIFDFETLKMVDCNQEALELYGYTKQQFLNLTIKDIRPEEDIDLINKVTKSEEAYGEIHKDIWRHKKKNGVVMYVHINGHLIDYEGRRCSFVLVTDITEKLKVDEAIKASELQRELIMNAALDAIICINKKGEVTFWNPQAEHIFGWDEVEVMGKNLTKLIVPNVHRHAHDAGMKHYLNTKEGPVLNKLLELSALNKAGKEFPIELTVIPIKQGDDEFFCSFIRDISVRKKSEQLIIESEVKYRTMIESSMDAILLTIKNGEILSTNEAACKIFQMTHDEVIAAGRNGLVDISDPRLIPLLEERERVGKVRGELTFKRKDGSKFPGEITSVVFKDANGQERTSMIIRDISIQKNAEKEILESNQRYNYVTRATSDAIWDWDLTTNLIYWGDGFNKIFGYEKTVIEPDISSWTNRIHPEDYPKVLKSIHDYINNSKFDKNWYEEYRFLKADGNYAFVEDKGTVIRNSNGDATRMVGALQDVTKKKEEDLRLKLLESVVTNSNDSVIITEAEPKDNSGPRILYVNEAFTKMTGYLPEEVIGKTPAILQGPKSNRKELDRLLKALKNWEPCEITTINYKKNGDEFYVNFSVSPVADSKGWFTHWVALERDVTENVLAQQKLMASYDERNTILESIDDGFFATDKNSIVTYWNKKAEILLGATKEEVLGKNLHEMFAKPNSMGFHDQYQLAINENKTVHFEEYSARSKKWFEVSAFASENGLSVYFKDTTSKKQAESQLIELNQTLLKQTKELITSNQELEQFAYVASHDLQEPLRMITSFLAQIEKKYADALDEKGKQYIFFAIDGAKRMRQIILDLLEFSRVGKQLENIEDVDINDIIKEIKLLYRKQIDESSASFEYETLPDVKSYKTPIRQVLQNLISNALKYYNPKTPLKINIEVKETDKFWQFSIKDNGLGIDKEYHQKIFVIFQRLHNKDEYSGTGMGLSICKKIVESLGGDIWVEAEEGKGSNFYFTILKN